MRPLFLYICCENSRNLKQYFEIIYWLTAVLLISLIFTSLTESYGQAIVLAVTLLPCVLFAKFFGSTISYKNRRRAILETIYLLLIVLIMEYLFIILICCWHLKFQLSEASSVLFNPLFIWFLLITFLAFEKILSVKLAVDKAQSKFIEFTSERRKVKIEVDTILYVESRDDVVFVVTANGEQYRTKMNISLWSNVLDIRFVRVHRAFIVNKSYVSGMSLGRLKLTSGAEIDVSKRYRNGVEEWFANAK